VVVDPDLASYLRIEERELEAGGVSRRIATSRQRHKLRHDVRAICALRIVLGRMNTAVIHTGTMEQPWRSTRRSATSRVRRGARSSHSLMRMLRGVIPWLIFAVIIVPLVVVAFVVTRRKSAGSPARDRRRNGGRVRRGRGIRGGVA
jgi:hypothetical protein